jgi:hypothetical protein
VVPVGALLASIALIVVATLGPFNPIEAGRIPPAWCLRCGGLWLTDAISNVVLFAPFGIALSLRRWRWWQVMLVSAAFSLVVECLQSVGIPPSRSPATSDLVANSVGGLCGVWLVSLWHGLLHPTRAQARVLAVCWTLGVIAILTLTTLALGPRGGASNEVRFARSRFTYAPGFGFFRGVVTAATVNGVPFANDRNGPVIVQATGRPDSLHLAARITGREELRNRKPLLYVHTPDDTSAVAAIVQHGDDAEVLIARRAYDWGLALPSLVIRNAFAGRTLDDTRPLSLEARAMRDRIELTVQASHVPNGHAEARLLLPPTLGWAMIQTIVDTESRWAWPFLVCWLFVLLAPVGWWSMRSGSAGVTPSVMQGAMPGVVLVVCIALCALLLPMWRGVAPVPMAQWVTGAMCLVAGAALSRWRRAPTAEPRRGANLRPGAG